MSKRILMPAIAGFAILLFGCASSPEPQAESELPLAIKWVRDAAEYRAVSLQVYRSASDALPGLLADESWSAVPYQTGAGDLPPAIIMDVDETAVTNVMFQVTLQPPFRDIKLENWNNENQATPVPGAAEFVKLARDAGVEVFFVTNRPCELRPNAEHPCPHKPITIQDLAEAGMPTDASHVLLRDERPGWGGEKKTRRDWVAKTHRVIMLFGDDLGDFIACVRRRPSGPCTEGGTIANRFALTDEHREYWGAGWFVLPNPMHGSWTSVP